MYDFDFGMVFLALHGHLERFYDRIFLLYPSGDLYELLAVDVAFPTLD
jgi:hypothetical protein